MTRLADALARAGGAPALRPADVRPVDVRPAEVSVQSSAAPARSVLAPEAPAHLVRAPHGDEAVPARLLTNPRLEGKLFGTPGLPHACVEQYRKLAATLHHLQTERELRTLMISSGMPGEGKTLTATNVALTLSESYGRRVLLIDADLRRPTIHQLFDLPNLTGLGDGLRNETDHALPLVGVSPRLTVLTAGRPDPDPMSGLTSNRMRRVITEASALFDWVLIDTPPVGLLSDGRLLSNMVGGVLLVIRAGHTPFTLVTRAIEAVGRERIIGVVLNAISAADLDATSYGSYGYGYYGPPSGEKRHGRREE
jgi:capsular exopolysaccharide synthesis family protein